MTKKKEKKSTGLPSISDKDIPSMPEVKPPKTENISDIETLQEKQILDLLFKEPELKAKLSEALETGRVFITVTFQKKYKPDDENDLHHYWLRKNIMVNDVVPVLKHIASDFIARENPTAELPDKTAWH